jgi:two-component system NtrC family sensor kinase
MQERRRNIFLLRGLLLFAVGAQLFAGTAGRGGVPAVVLLAAYGLSNIALLWAPARWFTSPRFELALGAVDVALVALGIHLSGAVGGALPISCLLMVLVVALGHHRMHAVAGAAAVGALHSWLVVGRGLEPPAPEQLALQVLFLCAVALYYGHLVGDIHRRVRRRHDQLLERHEMSTIREILDAITSSLDVQEVARTIVCKITSVIPAVRCSMIFISERRDRCWVLASNDNPELRMLEIDLKKYPEIRHAIETRNPVLIQDAVADPLMIEVKAVLEQLDFNSIMVFPLNFGADVLGTLCLKTVRSEQEFNRSEIAFCCAVAQASANALKNALLHRQVEDEANRHRRTSRKLGRILDHSPDLIVTTDEEDRIVEFNRGAERLLGRSRRDVVGKPCRELFVDPEDADQVEWVRTHDRTSSRACRLPAFDGETRHVELHLAALPDDEGHIEGTVWVGRDVTELKDTQRQLVQAEKLSSIGEVISGVAHELNNPLCSVIGFSQLLAARNPDGPFARELERINESATRCQKIVKNLLSFSRLARPEKRHIGVNGLLEKTLELKRYQFQVNNIELVKELEPDLPLTMLDFHQLQQVFVNLLNNAEQAMSRTGRPAKLVVKTSLRENTIRVEITDNGDGMDAATLDRIFEPFFTTKDQGEGTGLGLSVSYGIVQEHEGRITARSQPGQGTTFTVELPVKEPVRDAEAAKLPNATEGPVTPSCPGGRVLLVDDEPMILDLLIDILEGAGYETDTASNGEEAARKVQTSGYDAVISDVRMPRMNGMELYENILSNRPELAGRVIFLTGDLIENETASFLGRHEAPSLGKPLEIADVLKAVEIAISRESAAAR